MGWQMFSRGVQKIPLEISGNFPNRNSKALGRLLKIPELKDSMESEALSLN
jgi:hypothetical protein